MLGRKATLLLSVLAMALFVFVFWNTYDGKNLVAWIICFGLCAIGLVISAWSYITFDPRNFFESMVNKISNGIIQRNKVTSPSEIANIRASVRDMTLDLFEKDPYLKDLFDKITR